MNNKISNYITDYSIFNNNNPNFILILLHGYGSSKEDLHSLTTVFNSLKDTMLVIPNAPFPCDIGERFQWFPVQLNEQGIKMNLELCKEAFDCLNIFISNLHTKYNIPFSNIGIFGFSQGGVMALMNGLYSQFTVGAVVSHSGLLYNLNNSLSKLNFSTNHNPNILLIHGKNDSVVPFDYVIKTQEFLNKNKIQFKTFFKGNLDHHVDEETLKVTKDFFEEYVINK